MKKAMELFLVLALIICMTACSASQMTEDQVRTIVQSEIQKTPTPTEKETLSEDDIRRIVQEEIQRSAEPTVSADEITQKVLDSIAAQTADSTSEFVVGDKLTNTGNLPQTLPLTKDSDITVQDITITKSEILDPNDRDAYFYSVGYTFYRYKYLIKVKGYTDSQYAGKYIRVKFYIPNGEMAGRSVFKGNVLFAAGGGSYNHNTDISEIGGCVFLIQEDGSFEGEAIGYSNSNLQEFMINTIYIS